MIEKRLEWNQKKLQVVEWNKWNERNDCVRKKEASKKASEEEDNKYLKSQVEFDRFSLYIALLQEKCHINKNYGL